MVTTSRFWAKVDRRDDDDCWLWTAAVDRKGYGKFWNKLVDPPKLNLAHRFAYELLVGPIPDGLVLDHLCRVPACVNPAHLEPVTNGENVLRSPDAFAAVNARKTHCPRGHAYDIVTSQGYRKCRTCERETNRAASARYRASKRAGREAG